MFRKMISAIVCAVFLLTLTVNSVFAEEKKTNTVTWAELEAKIRKENLSSKAFEESINSIETVNYTNMFYSLKNQINQLAAAQEFMVLTGQQDKVSSLAQSATALRATYEDIRDGKLQRDSENAVNQLRDAQNQFVLAGQTLYINILSMERSLKDGERGVQALERVLTELRLRKEYGQVSDKNIEDVEKNLSDTISGLQTLRSTISSCKAQLQIIIGCEPTGEIELGELPEISGNEISEIDYEADLVLAKEKSYALKNAKIALDKAEESYKDAETDFVGGNVLGYQRDSARYAFHAEKLNYDSAVNNFEYSFKEMYRTLADCRQILENKLNAVKYQERQLEIARTQYEFGRISYFDLLTAQDSLETAKSEASGAKSDFFTALNKYRNAVEYGIAG